MTGRLMTGVHPRHMQSMTGFGRGSAQAGEWLANVEAGSVNRKQAEVVVQMSREFSSLETEVRKTVLDRISRGRVNVSISLERAGGDSAVLKVDASLAKALHDAFREISILTGEDVLPAASDYLRHPGLIATGSTESDPQDAWRVIEPALRDAVEALVTMRSSEGAHLKADLEARVGALDRNERGLEAVLARASTGPMKIGAIATAATLKSRITRPGCAASSAARSANSARRRPSCGGSAALK